MPAGTTLALVGETGSGKSTLAALATRLYDPAGGRITIDGVDLRDLKLADLAAIVGVVSQETYLLHTTVRENLRYAKPGATDAEIENAARAAQIHQLIASLPEGYDTVVGSRGHRFSGGEKQRLAIARTLLRNPRILVLDEATSALDTETERAVQQAFDTLAEGRTTITIAHRLSTVRDADQIVVIDHGRAVESGTHTSLVADNGRYATLIEIQQRFSVQHGSVTLVNVPAVSRVGPSRSTNRTGLTPTKHQGASSGASRRRRSQQAPPVTKVQSDYTGR